MFIRTDRLTTNQILKVSENGVLKTFNGQEYYFKDASTSYRFENGSLVLAKGDTPVDVCDGILTKEPNGAIKLHSKVIFEEVLKEYKTSEIYAVTFTKRSMYCNKPQITCEYKWDKKLKAWI